MNPAIVMIAFVLYAALVFTFKRMTYPKHAEPSPPFPHAWEEGHEYTLMLSQDFWWAKRFKSRIKQFQSQDLRLQKLKIYVQENNKLNFWVSLTLTGILFCFYTPNNRSVLFDLLLMVGVIRFISRSFEIAYAFGKDVLQTSESATGLSKIERVRLALLSYAEIFVYSTAAYLALPTVDGPLDALVVSLSVGTLTNVGFAFGTKNVLPYNILVFVQVFTTLSLVVLSLASYLSREK
jgi:hypothetical protein